MKAIVNYQGNSHPWFWITTLPAWSLTTEPGASKIESLLNKEFVNDAS